MKSKGRRLSVQEKVESKRSGVPRLRVLFALFAALLVIGVAAGCGSDDSSSDSSSGGTSGGATTTAKDAAKSGDQTVSAGVSDYADYVGAKSSGAADSSKAPITIGWVNQEGGPTDVGPGSTKGADLAVKYLNEKLGGIGGHPVKLFKCFTSTSEEQGQTCGQKMVNNKDVKVIAMGAVAIGDQSLVATVNGTKPMVTSVAIGAADAKNKNGYGLFGDGIRVSGPFATYASKVVGAKKVSVVWPELPGINESSQAIVDGSKKLGMETQERRLEPERDRPRRPADGSRCSDGRRDHPELGSEGLRQPLQGAAVAEDHDARRVGAAVHQRAGLQGDRRLPAVDVRHRVDPGQRHG